MSLPEPAPRRNSPSARRASRGSVPAVWWGSGLLVLAALLGAFWILSRPDAGAPSPGVAVPTAGPARALATPTATPPTLQVGSLVQVAGTGASQLSLRGQPSRVGEVLLLVSDGAIFQVVGGPAQSDGYTWWQLQDLEGHVGWAVGQWLQVLGSTAP